MIYLDYILYWCVDAKDLFNWSKYLKQDILFCCISPCTTLMHLNILKSCRYLFFWISIEKMRHINIMWHKTVSGYLFSSWISGSMSNNVLIRFFCRDEKSQAMDIENNMFSLWILFDPSPLQPPFASLWTCQFFSTQPCHLHSGCVWGLAGLGPLLIAYQIEKWNLLGWNSNPSI